MFRSVDIRNHFETKTLVQGSNISAPYRIAIDWIANNIYWTDLKAKIIEVASLDGQFRKKILKGLKEPLSIALHPKEGYLFWVELGDHPSIERARLDGSNKKSIVSSDLILPNGLSVDYANKKIFWADAMKHRIEMSDLQGRYRIPLIAEAKDAFGLTQVKNLRIVDVEEWTILRLYRISVWRPHLLGRLDPRNDGTRGQGDWTKSTEDAHRVEGDDGNKGGFGGEADRLDALRCGQRWLQSLLFLHSQGVQMRLS